MVKVRVRAHPGAKRDQVQISLDGIIEAWLTARPVEGKANQALVGLVAQTLGLRHHQVRLVQGSRSRLKLLEVDVESMEELRKLLERDARRTLVDDSV